MKFQARQTVITKESCIILCFHCIPNKHPFSTSLHNTDHPPCIQSQSSHSSTRSQDLLGKKKMPGRFPGESLLRQRWMCPCDNQRVQTCLLTASLCLEQYPALSVYITGNTNERRCHSHQKDSATILKVIFFIDLSH